MACYTVTARCVSCGATRDIEEGEVPAGEQPECHKCPSIMVAVSAQKKKGERSDEDGHRPIL